MKRGAVVFMDALGFKGIWKRKDTSAESVIEKLHALQEAARRQTDALKQEFLEEIDPSLDVQVTMLSDTIVIGVSVEGLGESIERDDGSEWPIFVAEAAAAAILREAAQTDPVLAYRGVVVFGEFLMSGPFLIGPAIDEASRLERSAEAGVVWLAPSAMAVLQAHKLDSDDWTFVRWEVPLKGGGRFETAVVSPFRRMIGDSPTTDHLNVQHRLLASFSSPDLEVQVKRQNTQRFLEYARAKLT